MSEIKYGFIGCGNMGSALALALAKNIKGCEIALSDHDEAKKSELAEKIGAKCSSNAEIAEKADYIFIAVKPQMLGEMFSEIKNTLKTRADRFVLVSMAAGTSVDRIYELAGAKYPVIRIMPNTPASVGKGMILYTAGAGVTDEEKKVFARDMSGAGILDELPERLIDAASALSGCGPAFVYLFAEALADGAVECGLPRDKAMLYAAQTIAGSAELLLRSGKHPGALKDAVCSPGGTTIAGVHELENRSFRAAAMSAVTEAYKKTLELAKK